MAPRPTQPQDQSRIKALLKAPLKKLIEEEVDPDYEQEKIIQYRMMRRNHLYFEGKQNIVPTWTGAGFADFSSVGAPVSVPPGQQSQFSQDYVFNIIRGDCLKAMGVMGKAPRVKGVADDPESDDGERQGDLADIVALDFDAKWDIDELTRQTAYILWMYSPAYAWTRYSSDGARYGYTEEPVIESQDVPIGSGQYACPTCGERTEAKQNSISACPTCATPLSDQNFIPPDTVPVPFDTGQVNRYENGTVEVDILSAFEASHSFYGEKKKDLDYFVLDRDMPKGKVLSAYRGLQDKQEGYDGMTAGKQQGIEARGTTASPSGVRFPHPSLWRVTLYWVKPSLYKLVKGSVPDELGSATPQKLSDVLAHMFPNGLRLDYVNGELEELRDENLDDVISICKPTVSKKIMSDPLCTDEIPIQDIYNNTYNMAEETVMKSTPLTIMSNRLIDRESMENRPPGVDMIWANPGAGDNLSEQVYEMPMARLSPDVMPLANAQRESGRELIGVNRSIYGGYDPTEKTAKQALIEKQMALMQLSIPYDNIRRFICDLKLNAVRQLAKYGTGKIRVASNEGMLGTYSRTADIAELKEEGYHFEADEGFPEGVAERRDMIKDLMVNAPPIATAVGFDSPYNSGRLQDYLGVKGMYSPVEAAREKVRRAVKSLLQGNVVQVDPYDDHVIMADLLQAWMISDEGMEQQQSNPSFQNVVNFWQQHKLASLPPPPPPGAPPPNNQPAPPGKPMGKGLHAKPQTPAGTSGNIAPPQGVTAPGPLSAPAMQLPIQ